MNALISVIICTYQGERFLEAALQSIADQQDAALEVIAIDDGSTDRTLEILRQFADRLPLKIIAGKRTGNWIVNTNRGLREARGDYICFLHQDDLWAPRRLQALRKMIADFPDCSLFVHPSDYIDDAGCKVGCWSLPFPRRAALLNCEVSIMLAQLSHGARPEYSRVLKTAARLSPPAWQRFLRDSRIIPRLTSRLRVRFGKPAA